MRVYRIESTPREYRGTESTETTGESRVQDQSRMRECTEMREQRVYRVESAVREAETRVQRVESTVMRVECKSTARE